MALHPDKASATRITVIKLISRVIAICFLRVKALFADQFIYQSRALPEPMAHFLGETPTIIYVCNRAKTATRTFHDARIDQGKDGSLVKSIY
jgi:hypothetical protein